VQNWLKTQPKNFFSGGIKKKTCEMLEPVRWSRGGLRGKVTLVSFLYIYSKCAFSFRLTLVINYEKWSFKIGYYRLLPLAFLFLIHNPPIIRS
jgi:hypothetical protein